MLSTISRLNPDVRPKTSPEESFVLPQYIVRMAHDIRSPLSALNLVLHGLDVPEPKRRLLESALHRINDIANDLVARGKSAQTALHAAPPVSDVGDLVGRLIDEKRVQYQGRREIDITGELADGGGHPVAIGEGELARTLSNLIDNAVEACPRAGRVHVSMGSIGDTVWIRIEDNGIGMDAATLARAGRCGFTTGKVAGNGLGVYFARRSAERAGGSLRLESSVGKGTAVVLTLKHATDVAL